jgi:hypothetical protein
MSVWTQSYFSECMDCCYLKLLMDSCNWNEGDIIQQLDKYNILTDHSNTILFSECMDCCCLKLLMDSCNWNEGNIYKN